MPRPLACRRSGGSEHGLGKRNIKEWQKEGILPSRLIFGSFSFHCRSSEGIIIV